jgi:hypothetical protein
VSGALPKARLGIHLYLDCRVRLHHHRLPPQRWNHPHMHLCNLTAAFWHAKEDEYLGYLLDCDHMVPKAYEISPKVRHETSTLLC